MRGYDHLGAHVEDQWVRRSPIRKGSRLSAGICTRDVVLDNRRALEVRDIRLVEVRPHQGHGRLE